MAKNRKLRLDWKKVLTHFLVWMMIIGFLGSALAYGF